jgi:hypothetical protein
MTPEVAAAIRDLVVYDRPSSRLTGKLALAV